MNDTAAGEGVVPSPDAIQGLPNLAQPDHDPWLWLEEVEGERATQWVAAQNAATLARFADADFAATRDAIQAMMDRPDRLLMITQRGPYLYNFWRDAAQPRGVWRRCMPDSFASGAPDWDVLVDLDAIAAEEAEDWVWKGASTLPGSHDRAMLELSRGGSDAVVIREFDMATRRFVPDGFVMPQAKGRIAWVDRDTLLLMAALGDGHATRSGYARTARLWRRGTDPLAAPVLFEIPEASLSLWASVDREAPPERRIVFVEFTGFYGHVTQLGDLTGPKRRMELPEDAEYLWDRDWLAVRLRSPWSIDGTTHAADTLLGIGLEDFLAGGRGFHRLCAPRPRQSLQGFFWNRGRLVVKLLDELRPTVRVFSPGRDGWTEGSIPGLPRDGVATLWPLHEQPEESDGTLLAIAEDPLTPPTMLRYPPDLQSPSVLQRAPRLFIADGLQVTRHEAISVDGERIPYVQAGPPGETGEAPVHMTGYGGFRVSLLPHYEHGRGKLWLERGGTTVLANIRGGGEFGTAWHDSGRREHKHLAHEDFAAVAADLVRRGVTRPGRIAAEGGSNGGLLIGNMLVRHPDKFGALFCTIPLLDMRRYTKLLAGASWMDEYGDPDLPADWQFLQQISAYHRAEPGRSYPPILIATTRRDDRVHPGHARKMAAKLQAMGYAAHYHEPAAGGHGYGKDNAEIAAFSALGNRFLRQAIGWEA